MYPLIRFAKEVLKFRNAPKLGPLETHVSTHRCWPWDLDPWIELNNGRTLTLYDLGRLPLAMRTGLSAVLRQTGWGITVAGNTTRYRRRIRAFNRFTMLSRIASKPAWAMTWSAIRSTSRALRVRTRSLTAASMLSSTERWS